MSLFFFVSRVEIYATSCATTPSTRVAPHRSAPTAPTSYEGLAEFQANKRRRLVSRPSPSSSSSSPLTTLVAGT